MKTICIIDDEKDVRSFLRELLESEGYRVAAFENPYPAFTFVYENRPDLVILDLCMPHVDGLSLLPALRAVSSDTPVLLLTGHGSPKVFLDAFEKGACEVVSKPVHPVDLVCMVRRLTGALEGVK
jgi:DNA-binding NtrC family response regulator